MLSVILIGIGVAAIFVAVVPVLVGLPDQQRLSRRVMHLRPHDRRMLTSTFLRRDVVPGGLGDEASALARLHWSQRFTALSSAGIAIMLIGLVLTVGEWTLARWAAALGVPLAVVGAVVAARQAVAGRRFLHRLAGRDSGDSHAVSE